MENVKISNLDLTSMPVADDSEILQLAVDNASLQPLAGLARKVDAFRTNEDKARTFQVWLKANEPKILKFLRSDGVSEKRGLEAAKVLWPIRYQKNFRLVTDSEGVPYKNFSDFAVGRYGMDQRRAYQLAAAGGVLVHIEDAHDADPENVILPTSERQIRALTVFKDDSDQMKAVWMQACASAGGTQPSAKQVEEAVASVRPRAKKLNQVQNNAGEQSSEQESPDDFSPQTNVPNDSIEYVMAEFSRVGSDLLRLVSPDRRETLDAMIERHRRELEELMAELSDASEPVALPLEAETEEARRSLAA